MLHHMCMKYCYDIREINTLSRMDNASDLWWQRKLSDTWTSPPAHLLQLHVIHQRFHRCITCHDFVSGVDNGIYDHPYRYCNLTYTALIE